MGGVWTYYGPTGGVDLLRPYGWCVDLLRPYGWCGPTTALRVVWTYYGPTGGVGTYYGPTGGVGTHYGPTGFHVPWSSHGESSTPYTQHPCRLPLRPSLPFHPMACLYVTIKSMRLLRAQGFGVPGF